MNDIGKRHALLALGVSVSSFLVLILLWTSNESEPSPRSSLEARWASSAGAEVAAALEVLSPDQRSASGARPVHTQAPAEIGPSARRGDSLARRDDLLAGRVLDALSGEPVEAFSVSYRLADEHGVVADTDFDLSRAVVRVDPGGGFRFTGLSPGTYSVLIDARASGYEKALIHGVRLPSPSLLTVRVDRSAHVEGHVLDLAGRPVAGFELLLENVSAASPPSERTARRATDEAGRFLFTRVTPGTYRLATTGSGRSETSAFSVLENARVERDITLPVAGALHITVLGPARTPLAGATALIAGRGALRSARGDADGIVRIGGLSGERYALEVSRPGFRAHYRDIELRGNVARDLEIVLEPSGR